MTILSKFYDFYDGPEHREDQFEFYTSLFNPDECELLELACGTGIIAIELARRKFQIVGIDYDEDMLAIARRKLAMSDEDTQRRVQFQCADMKDFTISKQFGATIIPTNSFGYLFKLEDQRACLEQVRKHLLPKGRLVIEERYSRRTRRCTLCCWKDWMKRITSFAAAQPTPWNAFPGPGRNYCCQIFPNLSS